MLFDLPAWALGFLAGMWTRLENSGRSPIVWFDVANCLRIRARFRLLQKALLLEKRWKFIQSQVLSLAQYENGFYGSAVFLNFLLNSVKDVFCCHINISKLTSHNKQFTLCPIFVPFVFKRKRLGCWKIQEVLLKDSGGATESSAAKSRSF